MSGKVQLNEDEKTWERIFRTSAALYRLREMELDRVGLSLSQAAALYFLKTSPEPLTPMRISRLIHKEPHTTAALLRRMESRGLIKRTKDLHRKNWVRVSLTKKGEAAFQRQMNERTAMNMTSCLSRTDVVVLNKILRELYDAAVDLIRQMKPTPYDNPLI